jgi:hypothetical protein
MGRDRGRKSLRGEREKGGRHKVRKRDRGGEDRGRDKGRERERKRVGEREVR